MSQSFGFDRLLCIPHLQVQNASCISSPLTHGFPSMTAFLGLMWALERRMHSLGVNVMFNAVGVVCHKHQELVSDQGYVRTLRLTRNPVDKSGKTAAIVEEGRMHMDISLIFAVTANAWNETPVRTEQIKSISKVLATMRVAGGSIIPPQKPYLQRFKPWSIAQSGDEADEEFRSVRRRLLPGQTLVLRDDLLDQRFELLSKTDNNASRLDAWLSLVRFNWQWQENDQGKDEWISDRPKGSGWIVPIPVGYTALSQLYPAGQVANVRDQKTPFRFVESIYSIGEWLGPHRIDSARQMLWYGDSDPVSGLYRCRNEFSNSGGR